MSELAKALAAFQAELPNVAKGATADTGSYSYDYADLTAVSRAVMPLLGKHGLSFTARPTFEGDRFVLAYSLLHESGERVDGFYPLPDKGTPQVLGSAITYARRYALLAVTGVAPGGEDDDGAAAEQAPRPQVRAGINYVTAQFNRLQVTDPAVQLGYAAALTGTAVNELSDYDDDTLRALFTDLKSCANQAALEQRSKQEAIT